MFDALRTSMRNLSGLVMISVAVDLLLPPGSMRKYARFVAGLLLLLAVLSPFLQILGHDPPAALDAAKIRLTVAEEFILEGGGADGVQQTFGDLFQDQAR